MKARVATKILFGPAIPFVRNVLLAVVGLTTLFAPGTALAGKCSAPPFVSVSLVPNVLIVLDNSASMYDLAYAGDDPASSYCYDDSYDSPYDAYTNTAGKTYYGYYAPQSWYIYNEDDQRFEETNASATECTNIAASEEDYCVKIDDDGSLVYAMFTGNVLNWLTMSKMDLEKKVLTGGKYDGTELIGESRGCVGKRFIKEIKSWVRRGNSHNYDLESSGIVFAVRADPLASMSTGGTTAIEIYQAGANWNDAMEDCLYAIGCFTVDDAEGTDENSPFGKCQNAIKGCLGFKPGGPDKWEVDEEKGEEQHQQQRYGFAAFVHSVHVCYRLAHPRGGREVPNTGDVQSIESICKSQYAHLKRDEGDMEDVWDILNDPKTPLSSAPDMKKRAVRWALAGATPAMAPTTPGQTRKIWTAIRSTSRNPRERVKPIRTATIV